MAELQAINKLFLVVSESLLECYKCSKYLSNSSFDDHKEAQSALAALSQMIKEIPMYGSLERLQVVERVAAGYHRYLSSVLEYESFLKGYVSGNESVPDVQAQQYVDKIKLERENLCKCANDYSEKYSEGVSTYKDIQHILKKALEEGVAALKESKDSLVQKANEIANRVTVTLQDPETVPNSTTLPRKITIAREDRPCSYEVLSELHQDRIYEGITIDFKINGNVMVQADYQNMETERLDEFVLAYVFRLLEDFPLGTINIHLFDRNPNYLNRWLYNTFQDEKYGEKTRRIVKLYDYATLNEVKDITSIINNDIFRKISVESPDLYALHEMDDADPFNLVVLRDGLLDSASYNQMDLLNTINSLTRPGETGHKSGIRFLIIEDKANKEKARDENLIFLMDSIRKNCEMFLTYDGKRFLNEKNEEIETLSIQKPTESFVQTRSAVIAQTISNLEKKTVSLDVEEDSYGAPENVIRIPVGKVGNSSVEIPLSCKDEKGTVDGQCIGFMVIGQSGSGKSSFFHSVVIGGCMRYSPRDLQFWLLDFKFGGSSSKYRGSQIPHVRIVAENNHIEDALCLFQMITEEMERRNRLFNDCMVDNIVDYNRCQTINHLPRILIMIDEVQEIFRDDNASVLSKMISSISVRMRSVGMHFVMVAQNLCEGKSYLLRESFMPSATGRICFRVASNVPRDSGFEADFVQRKDEIAELNTGEAYVSYGRNTIQKVKMAYTSPEAMNSRYFPLIREKYKEFADMRPLVIGLKQRLSVMNKIPNSNETYRDFLLRYDSSGNSYTALLGEDSYRMTPKTVSFSTNENSSLLILGNDKQLASSLCTSIALSLIRQGAKLYLFNGDKSKMERNGESVVHPFMQLCSSVNCHNASAYAPSKILEVARELYSEYLRRQNEAQDMVDDDASFEPRFMIINDLLSLKPFIDNETVQSEETPQESKPESFSFGVQRRGFGRESGESADGKFSLRIQDLFLALLKNGYRYNIHLVFALKGDAYAWKNTRVTNEVERVVLFNSTQYADQVENSFFAKEMLKNIMRENGEETLAVWYGRRQFSKIRPIIFDMRSAEEADTVISLCGGENA